MSVDLDHLIAEMAAARGLDSAAMPAEVLDVGATLLHDAMPLLAAPVWATHARWLPVLAEAFVEWACREHEQTGEAERY